MAYKHSGISSMKALVSFKDETKKLCVIRYRFYNGFPGSREEPAEDASTDIISIKDMDGKESEDESITVVEMDRLIELTDAHSADTNSRQAYNEGKADWNGHPDR